MPPARTRGHTARHTARQTARHAAFRDRRLGQVHAEPVSVALIAAGHLCRSVAQMFLDIALVDLGAGGETGADQRPGWRPSPRYPRPAPLLSAPQAGRACGGCRQARWRCGDPCGPAQSRAAGPATQGRTTCARWSTPTGQGRRYRVRRNWRLETDQFGDRRHRSRTATSTPARKMRPILCIGLVGVFGGGLTGILARRVDQTVERAGPRQTSGQGNRFRCRPCQGGRGIRGRCVATV